MLYQHKLIFLNIKLLNKEYKNSIWSRYQLCKWILDFDTFAMNTITSISIILHLKIDFYLHIRDEPTSIKKASILFFFV